MKLKFSLTIISLTIIHITIAQFHDSSIIIINIEGFNREQIGKVIKQVNKHNPEVIGLDVFFRENKGPDTDSVLVNALKKSSRLVFAGDIEKLGVISILATSHPKFFGKNSKAGFSHLEKNSNHVVSHKKVMTFLDKDTIYSFELQVVSMIDQKKFETIKRKYKVDQPVKINYNKSGKRFTVINGMNILNSTIDLSHLKNKIVLIGYCAENPDFSDKYYNSQVRKDQAMPDMFGVEIRAAIVLSLLNDH